MFFTIASEMNFSTVKNFSVKMSILGFSEGILNGKDIYESAAF
jgi:hypothetical protein